MAPSVLIVAPSASGPTDIINNFATGSGLFTTDLTTDGYNLPPLPGGLELDIDPFPDTSYTTRFGGTSGATPIVSGVIALMLEANPNLSYRDVEEILVRSARQNDDLDESWITNLVPLFRDPFQHNPGPTNYNGGAMGLYPSDEDQWNDEIVYQLVPPMPLTPAVQAATQPTPITVPGPGVHTFSVHAEAGQAWDGWVGNNLTVVFRTDPGGPSGALAEIVEGRIRITVSGSGVTWGDIEVAVELLGLGQDPMDPLAHWFDLRFANAADAGQLFDPADEAIRAPLADGVDATGVGSFLQRNPHYQGYHPIADPLTNPEPDSLFTNGAGFTVSHGRGGDSEYGYAHGVVDAALAVELARQWHLKDQNLPPEKTWVTAAEFTVPIRARQVTDEMSGEYVIPGALSYATEGFADYFNEFFKDVTVTAGMPAQPGPPPVPATPDTIDPMSLPFRQDDPPVNTRGNFLTFDVPAIDPVTGASNLMAMEWVEVQLNITGDANAMNYLRITLVSPDGTHSELTQNQYMPEDVIHNFQSLATGGLLLGLGDSITPQDENGTNSDTLDWVYSTNRIWGERSDSNPIFDEYGNLVDLNGWELHFENYSGADLQYNGVQIAFHGAPLGSPAGPVERVMGKVGVDSGRFVQAQNQIFGALDKEFNFDRYITTTSNNSHAFTSPSAFFGGTTPFGDHEIRVADPLQEQFAGNITVYAIDNASGQRVAEFLTGYDGNYYFDLPEGEYTLGIEDPLGRTALDINAGTARNYDNEWVLTIDTGDQFFRTAGEIDAISGKLNSFDDLNFLLDPGSLPPSEVIFTGQVLGDLDGDGTQDPQDVGVYNFLVYADLNHTNQFEIGEPFTVTDVDGNYTLPVPTATPNTFTIGIKAPTGWSPTSPATGFISEYALPGDQVSGFKYLFEPPSTPSGEGNGTIFGFIFNDKSGDGIQQQNEDGLAGVTVFIDADLDGEFDQGVEIYTTTTASGAYQFGDVGLGTVRIDAVVEEPFSLTAPVAGYIAVSLIAGQVSTGNNFAIQNLAVDDFGDLVGEGFQTTGANAASHFAVPGFSLGATIDAEIRPRSLKETAPGSGIYVPDPTKNGVGDDQPQSQASFDDEDGVVLVGGFLRPGANSLSVTVNGVGGILQGWIDFNNDGMFGAGEQVFTNVDLNQGTHQLLVTAPQSLVAGQVAARFRWGGDENLGFSGHANIGEVEDYLFVAKVPIPGDYNADDMVDNADYLLWKSTFGSVVDLRADGNMNGIVDTGDYTIWRDNNGAGVSGAAAGLVQVGAQPDGGLEGKIVFVHGGHGFMANNTGSGSWNFQRPNLNTMIEDLGNQDQMTTLVDYMFNAGATVVPMRPVGHQTHEVVLDNDDPHVTYYGNWSNGIGSVYFGSAGDVPNRVATASATESAFARYQPEIPEAGFYPVYAWTPAGDNSATDQLYRIHHSGGTTEVKINHRRVGNGQVYLGTYYFEAGTKGYVDISNKSDSAGSIVVADMIRFGNGLGDIDRGAGNSGIGREDEGSVYWMQWQVDHSQGIPTSEYRVDNSDATANVRTPPRYAEFMNREAEGPASDRLFVSFHSNASADATQRGVLGLWNNLAPGNNNTPTPNQLSLADTLGQEINDDLVIQEIQVGGSYWFNRGSDVTLGGSFGEIDNRVIFDEFDATIMEVGFHDNVDDAEMLRDPRVRDAIAKATYQGIVKFFRSIDGNITPVEAAPPAVTHLRAESNAAGQVTVTWTPTAASPYGGDDADGYRIYASVDGYGFDGGTFVAGGATTSLTLSGYDANLPYYFKVVAVNEGGESSDSEVLAALPSGGPKQVLIVSGFDRLDLELDPKQAVNSGSPVDRVRPRWSNSRDYTVQVAQAMDSAAPGVHVNSASNEAVIAGAVNLGDYDTVIWILGQEFAYDTADGTAFDATEQTKVTQFINGGGNLFLSGSNIGDDLDLFNRGKSFYESTLLADWVSGVADSGGYQANGVAGQIFAGLSLTFDNGSLFYDVDDPDVIAPQAGALGALTYASGAAYAAIQVTGTGGKGSIVMLAFPFETITTAANRTAVMDRVLDFFTAPGAGGGALAPLVSEPTLDASQSSPSPVVDAAQLTQLAAHSTLVGHSLDSPVLQLEESVLAEHADLALSLLASESDRSESTDDGAAAVADWLGDDGEESGALDLVLAAAFEDETDWRLAL
jgi:hypothetical protein